MRPLRWNRSLLARTGPDLHHVFDAMWSDQSLRESHLHGLSEIVSRKGLAIARFGQIVQSASAPASRAGARSSTDCRGRVPLSAGLVLSFAESPFRSRSLLLLFAPPPQVPGGPPVSTPVAVLKSGGPGSILEHIGLNKSYITERRPDQRQHVDPANQGDVF